MDELYQEVILDHARYSPHRCVMEAPDASASDLNPLCGDQIRVDLRLRDGRVERMTFSGQGCAISQAAASMLAELVEGQSIEAARDLDRAALLDTLGVRLSPARLKCALLPLAVLRQALGVRYPPNAARDG